MTSTTRTEADSFGPIEVPADAHWGAQTQRSIENFPFGMREAMPVEIVHALGFVKQAAARVNARLGGLDARLAGGDRPVALALSGGGDSMALLPLASPRPCTSRRRARSTGGCSRRSARYTNG